MQHGYQLPNVPPDPQLCFYCVSGLNAADQALLEGRSAGRLSLIASIRAVTQYNDTPVCTQHARALAAQQHLASNN